MNGCTNIQYFVLDGEIPTIQNVNNETLLLLKGVNTNIYIPEGTKDDYLAVTGWSEYASYLVEISVSEGIIKDGDILVKVINTNKDITIQGVTTFSDYVFAGLKSLESLNIISDSLININDISMLFYGVNVENLTIYVSNNLLSQYQNHTLWGEYEDNFVGVA